MPGSPSACGTIDCHRHGERFTAYNIAGTCCGGLDDLMFEHVPEKLVMSGVNVSICYDSIIGEPMCLLDKKVSGRYLPAEPGGERKLVTPDRCRDVYQDYYSIVDAFLQEQPVYCQYTDEAYTRVDFKDISRSRSRAAIAALEDFCIAK